MPRHAEARHHHAQPPSLLDQRTALLELIDQSDLPREARENGRNAVLAYIGNDPKPAPIAA